MTLVSVHPFGLETPGGGSKILRSLYRDPPTPVLSVVTSRHAPAYTDAWREIHLPLRPSLRPVDGTRYDHVGHALELALAPSARKRLTHVYTEHHAEAIHAVAHSLAFWPALGAAKELGIPYVLTVHDDLRYLLRKAAVRSRVMARLAQAWRAADQRFVISRALGEEYCARYGRADYTLVTDGLEDADFLEPSAWNGPELKCYFAGLFHRGYRANLQEFLTALAVLGTKRAGLRPSMRCRCGTLPYLPPTSVPLSVVAFGSSADVQADLRAADLLYLPLMFDAEFRDMTAFSLSTKLVTYLGSGVPIVYHGPPDTAAGRLLAANDAAIMATSRDPQVVAQAIDDGLQRAPQLVANAQALGRREFMLADQLERFWSAVYPRAMALV